MFIKLSNLFLVFTFLNKLNSDIDRISIQIPIRIRQNEHWTKQYSTVHIAYVEDYN